MFALGSEFNRSTQHLLILLVVAYTKSGKSAQVHKCAIVALVERDGSARAFHAAHADEVVITIVTDNIAKYLLALHANREQRRGAGRIPPCGATW